MDEYRTGTVIIREAYAQLGKKEIAEINIVISAAVPFGFFFETGHTQPEVEGGVKVFEVNNPLGCDLFPTDIAPEERVILVMSIVPVFVYIFERVFFLVLRCIVPNTSRRGRQNPLTSRPTNRHPHCTKLTPPSPFSCR